MITPTSQRIPMTSNSAQPWRPKTLVRAAPIEKINQVREETYKRTSPGAFKQLRGSLLRLCEAICEFCSFCAK